MDAHKKRLVLILFVILVVIFVIVRPYEHKSPETDAAYASKLSGCGAFPNGSEQKITDTSRVFIDLPKDIFPDKEHNLQFKTVQGSTTADWISNGGPYGEAMQSNGRPNCWSYYYEFDGQGEIDLSVKTAVTGMPDYSVRFSVTKNPTD